jgi:hypothetical protein
MIPHLIATALSACLALATEFYFPIVETEPIARKQRHFWAIILFIISEGLGLSISFNYQTQQKLEVAQTSLGRQIKLGDVYARLNPEIRNDYETIFLQYYIHFGAHDSMLETWAHTALHQVRDDLTAGWISLPRELAADQIALLYQEHADNIIATNVGSTVYYFNNGIYIGANNSARDRGIPVIRFYLYSANQHIVLSNGKVCQTIDEFKDDVGRLHTKLGSLYSLVIDVDEAERQGQLPHVLDVLILGSHVLAESQLSDRWELVRARATQETDNVNQGLAYFRTLAAIAPYKEFPMDKEDVRKYFPQYALRQEDATPARTLYVQIMKQTTGVPLL